MAIVRRMNPKGRMIPAPNVKAANNGPLAWVIQGHRHRRTSVAKVEDPEKGTRSLPGATGPLEVVEGVGCPLGSGKIVK